MNTKCRYCENQAVWHMVLFRPDGKTLAGQANVCDPCRLTMNPNWITHSKVECDGPVHNR